MNWTFYCQYELDVCYSVHCTAIFILHIFQFGGQDQMDVLEGQGQIEISEVNRCNRNKYLMRLLL